jgi:hypothetical protein
MNTALTLMVLLLIIFALNSGMLWFAVALAVILAFVSLTEKKATAVDPNTRFFYPHQRLPPVGQDPNKGEQNINASFLGDWDGLEDDDRYHDLVGSKIGEGIGKGLGFFK